MFRVLVLVALLAQPCPCPGEFVAKYQCESGTWALDEGEDVLVIEGDCRQATVTGDYELWVKAGPHCEEQESPVHAIGGLDISHVSACGDPTSVGVVFRTASDPRTRGELVGLVLVVASLCVALAWVLLSRE